MIIVTFLEGSNNSCIGASIDSNSIYSSCVNSKYSSAQIYTKYEQILSSSLVSLTCVLYSFLCLSLIILIIGKTNSLHIFQLNDHNY